MRCIVLGHEVDRHADLESGVHVGRAGLHGFRTGRDG